MSRNSLVSAGASRAYDTKATNRPSALTATDGASNGERCGSCCTTVTICGDPTTPMVSAAAAVIVAAIVLMTPSIRPSRDGANFPGHGQSDSHGARRLEGNAAGVERVDAGVRQGRSGGEIHFIELFDDVFQLVRDELDLVFEPANTDGRRHHTTRLPHDAGDRAGAARPRCRRGLQTNCEPRLPRDPQALPPERGRAVHPRFQNPAI